MGPQVVGQLELVQKWSQKLPSVGMNRALILPEGINPFYRVLPLDLVFLGLDLMVFGPFMMVSIIEMEEELHQTRKRIEQDLVIEIILHGATQ